MTAAPQARGQGRERLLESRAAGDCPQGQGTGGKSRGWRQRAWWASREAGLSFKKEVVGVISCWRPGGEGEAAACSLGDQDWAPGGCTSLILEGWGQQCLEKRWRTARALKADAGVKVG